MGPTLSARGDPARERRRTLAAKAVTQRGRGERSERVNRPPPGVGVHGSAADAGPWSNKNREKERRRPVPEH